MLDLFAKDMKQKEVKLMFVSVNYVKNDIVVSELHDFPIIENHLLELDSLGYVDYININDWFEIKDMLPSPVGHYDKRWNFVLGDNLADYVLSNK